jgi:hypothetical protein
MTAANPSEDDEVHLTAAEQAVVDSWSYWRTAVTKYKDTLWGVT